MQKVAAYLLERRAEFETPEDRRAEFVRCIEVFQKWLQSKGAVDPSAALGSFRPEKGGEGNFEWEEANDGDRSWKLLRLDEMDGNGRRHLTSVSATNTGTMISVYVSIKAGLSSSAVRPVPIDPRCPRVVRDLFALGGDWFHGSSQLLSLDRVEGDEEGEWLAGVIADPDRTIPILVISEGDGGIVLPGLDDRADYDLTGLANTVVIDAEAAWGLTEALGKQWSCFSGGVRLYWPGASRDGDPFFHPLWTPARLRAHGGDLGATLVLFRRQLRQLIMRTSALSVLPSREIESIQHAEIVRIVDGLRPKVESDPDYDAIERSYAMENDELRSWVETLTRINGDLTRELTEARDRLSNAELMSQHISPSTPVIDPVGPRDAEEDEGPRPDDIRFYKCVDHKQKYDVMEQIGDCGHNNWQRANKAEKARKGIIRLESGRSDWRTLSRCCSCTGGSVWRVRW